MILVLSTQKVAPTEVERVAITKLIGQWHEMRRNPKTAPTPYKRDCPLCAVQDAGSCGSCVIKRRNVLGCMDTPWVSAESAWLEAKEAKWRGRALRVWRRAARGEIEFMRQLLRGKEQRERVVVVKKI